MKRMSVYPRQAVCLTALFLLGDIYRVSTAAGRDSWLALLFAAVAAIPVYLICGWMLAKAAYLDFFDMLKKALGRFGGALATVLLALYSLCTALVTLKHITVFITKTQLPNPPHIFPAILLFTAAYLFSKGAGTLAKWAVAVFAVVGLILVLTAAAGVPEMDFAAVLPLLDRPAEGVAHASLNMFAFPFLQCVLVLPVLSRHGNGIRPVRVMLGGLAIAALVYMLVTLQTLFLIGGYNLSAAEFPVFMAAKVPSVGSFFTRFEDGIAVCAILASLTKLSVCLYTAAKAVRSLFGKRVQ
ncbi:MAG: spore germination protein [Oscillospiraceae bacterium]|jgi:spore germination protein KB|nr:spore germination protein [Oscillospiraceae bacterium]